MLEGEKDFSENCVSHFHLPVFMEWSVIIFMLFSLPAPE